MTAHTHKQALLVHGNAWLKQFEMGEDADPGGAWFSQGKAWRPGSFCRGDGRSGSDGGDECQAQALCEPLAWLARS